MLAPQIQKKFCFSSNERISLKTGRSAFIESIYSIICFVDVVDPKPKPRPKLKLRYGFMRTERVCLCNCFDE